MAKVSYGPVVSDASGKSAGTVFSKWKTKSYVRRLVTPANPNSALQQQIRNAFRTQTARFLRFNSDLKQAWDNYVAGKPLTNRSAFIGQTVENERQNNPWIFTPHDPTVFPKLTLVVTTPVAGSIKLDWTNDIIPAAGNNLCFLVNQTDEGLTITMASVTLATLTYTFTGLIAGKTYIVGVVTKSTDTTPARYSIAVVDEKAAT